MQRKAKIVATIGPSCRNEEMLRQLVAAGVNVARLNFSHGTYDDHSANIALIRKVAREMGKSVAILQDLQGPKMRVANLPKEGISLYPGQVAMLVYVQGKGAPASLPPECACIPVDIPNLSKCLKHGDRILLDDGNLELETEHVEQDFIETRVVLGGTLTSHKGINLPGVPLDINGFTEKDQADLAFGIQQGVDAVALSFVRSSWDVLEVRAAIRQLAGGKEDLPIVAKLERPEAMDNLEAILNAADGVMVARGDLAVETTPASVPIMQKQIILAAQRQSKLVITATQMLDSMIHNPRPTRAEASDVANAIFDGTDAVMLSGETASGEYPLQSVQMMDTIVREAEPHSPQWGHCENLPEEPALDDAVSMARAARELAHDRDVAVIVVFTVTGRSAVLMSKARPNVPILALTPDERTYNRMAMYWGVTPYLTQFSTTVEEMLTNVEKAVQAACAVQPGQQVVVISGYPIGAHRPPNLAILHTIGDIAP